jgi:hypothetical protein
VCQISDNKYEYLRVQRCNLVEEGIKYCPVTTEWKLMVDSTNREVMLANPVLLILKIIQNDG